MIGFLATVASEKLASQKLDASIGASGPHDFAVRVSAVRQKRINVHRIPPHVRDDRDTPLLRDGIATYEPVIWPEREAEKSGRAFIELEGEFTLARLTSTWGRTSGSGAGVFE